MTVSDELLRDVTLIIITAIVVSGLVAVLAPAALGVFVKPLMDAISNLVALLEQHIPPNPPDAPK